ncbi:MAG: FAD binding domain-containing protein [Candidatus Omnitrophica bacterium]|nr:FAD binding domain-containing protein [Candidatus Omnitrophota bacterium]
MLLNTLTLHTPQTTSEAAKLFKELEDSKVLAGGTFLLNSLKLLKTKGTRTPKNILSLAKVADLKGISSSGSNVTIKAMTTITEIFESQTITERFPILHTICRNISTTPIRNMASFGGNLTCRYTWTELPVAMMALDAHMYFMSPDGTGSVLSAEDFFKNNARSEYLFTHATISHDPLARLAYRRVRKMSEVDQPLLSLCVKTSFKGSQWSQTRVVINSGTAFAQRDYLLEEFLNGKTSGSNLGHEAMNHLTVAIYDTRSTEYKQHMFRVSLRGAIEDLCKSN